MDDLDRQRGHVRGESIHEWVERELAWFREHPIVCAGCGATTSDPDRWDPDFLTGTVYCDSCHATDRARRGRY